MYGCCAAESLSTPGLPDFIEHAIGHIEENDVLQS